MITQQLLNSILSGGLDLIVAIGLGLLLKFVIPLIRSKQDAADLDYIKGVIKTAVAAAEEKFVGEKLGLSTRKPWVTALIAGLGIVVDDLIDAMIDEASRALTDTTKVIEAAATQAAAESPVSAVGADVAAAIVNALGAASGLSGAATPDLGVKLINGEIVSTI